MKEVYGTFLIKNGRVIDPANDLDEQADVLVVDGIVAPFCRSTGVRQRYAASRSRLGERSWSSRRCLSPGAAKGERLGGGGFPARKVRGPRVAR